MLNYRELTQFLHRLTISDLAKRDKFKPIKRNGQFLSSKQPKYWGGNFGDWKKYTTIHDIILPIQILPDVSSRSVQRDLTLLVSEGLIEQSGRGKALIYSVL